MINVLVGGGMGDSCLGLARIKYNFNLNDTHIIHWEVPQSLIQSINDFYKSQNVPNYTVENITSWNWARTQKDGFDYYLLNHFPWANKDNCFLESPNFMNFIHQKINNIDIVIQPAAGRKGKIRHLDINQIQKLIDRYPNRNYSFVGWADEEYYKNIRGNITSYLNATTINQFISILGSCNTFIGPTGFAMIFCSFLGKQVFFTHNIEPKYINSAWNAKEIKTLNEVTL